MKKFVRVLYFLILGLVFLLNSAQASHLRGECYLLFEDIGGNSYLVKSTDSESCNSYYLTSLEDFYYVSVEKFTEGSLGYKNLNKYINHYSIPIKVLPNVKTFQKLITKEIKDKYPSS